MRDKSAISIKEYAAKYTLIIFAVVFIAAVLHYLVYSQYLQGIQEKEHQKTLIQSANSVDRSLAFYQSVVDELASQHVVIDLLQFGTNEDTQEWASKMQRLLPESIGLALFDQQANVKGVKGELRLSDRCIADMENRLNNKPYPRPPVHHKIEELAHYDIASSIMVDGEQIGVVFASFSLDTIQRLITGLYTENQGLKITSPDGYLIAYVGDVIDNHNSTKVYKQKIKQTDWEIELRVKDSGFNVLVTSLLVSNLVAFVLISFTLYFAIKSLFNVVVCDFEILSWLMKKIKNGTYDSKEEYKVSLKESQNVIRFIKFTAGELNAYQNELKTESTTDELTGLHNRRELNREMENCLRMADHGQELFLVILDLDHFKKINDTYGHDAGDMILICLSDAIKSVSKEKDVCTRAGGDEFIVILIDYEPEAVQHWYKAIYETVSENIQQYNEKNNSDIQFGISAGATLVRNNDRKSTVLKRADNALYRVKEGGGNKIEFL